jgi:hypothetical protein
MDRTVFLEAANTVLDNFTDEDQRGHSSGCVRPEEDFPDSQETA